MSRPVRTRLGLGEGRGADGGETFRRTNSAVRGGSGATAATRGNFCHGGSAAAASLRCARVPLPSPRRSLSAPVPLPRCPQGAAVGGCPGCASRFAPGFSSRAGKSWLFVF
ncbi:unnamed protein product [Coccothraustes coccothraustes]